MADTEPFLGSINLVAFNFQPNGYLFCNGQLLSIAQNSALFALLGTTYGGDGQTTFALPDLRSRVPLHMGTRPGGASYVEGQIAGTESVTLNITQLPQHTHAFSNNGSSLNAIAAKATDQIPSTGYQLARPVDKNGTDTPQIYVPAATAGTVVALGGLNVAGTNAIAGGNQPFPILQPSLALNYVIATSGIFPTRN